MVLQCVMCNRLAIKQLSMYNLKDNTGFTGLYCHKHLLMKLNGIVRFLRMTKTQESQS